jgi:predicted aldo/keto reductase-like oxidoreductase
MVPRGAGRVKAGVVQPAADAYNRIGWPDELAQERTDDVEYRTLGSTGLRVSRLGFGCIKFKGCTQADVAAALHRALDLGVTYFDTARNYGDSEAKIGEAIAGRRDDFVVSTKSSGRTADALLADLETSLGNLRTDVVDILFLHTVSDPGTRTQVLAPGGALEGALRAKEQGKVRHIAVSIHRDLETMRLCIDDPRFEVLMPAYNVLDPEGAGALLPRAAAANMGVVVMKPLSGGQLVSPPGPQGQPLSPDPVVASALRWVITNPHVSTVIPGMINAQQVEDNVAAVEQGPLSEAERQEAIATVAALGKAYRYGQQCLRCGYCQPCPNEIDIPAIFRAESMARDYPDPLKHLGRELYEAQAHTAADCEECGRCVEKCPVGLDIPRRLRDVAQLFAG